MARPARPRGAGGQTASTQRGGESDAAAAQPEGCLPEVYRGTAPSPGPTGQADALPVGGGFPSGSDADLDYGRLALIFAGIALAIVGYAALRFGTRR